MNIILILSSIINLIIKINTLNFPFCFEYGCEECTDNQYGSCTKCKKNFKLIDGKCPCFDSNCLICESSLLKSPCHYCNKDSILFEEECYCNILSCENCRNNKCLKCNIPFSYSSDSNKCLFDFSYHNCYDSNCNFCSNPNEGFCLKCKEGYELINGNCYKLDECIKKDGKCIGCQDDNYYVNGNDYCSYKCLRNTCNNPFPNNLYKCEDGCLFCQNNKIYALSNCDNTNYCNIDNCLYCISKNECLYCNTGYYKINGKCEKCPNNCIDCSSSSKCNICHYEYKLNNENQCVKIEVKDNEYENEVIDFEIDYLEKKVNKLKNEGYNYTINDFLLLNNKNIFHCLKELNNYCYLCEPEYTLINGICYSNNCKVQNCEYCIDNNCYSCKKNYEKVYNSNKNSYICQKCEIENCIQCENNECKMCEKGYLLNENKCIIIDCKIDNCIECNDNKTCKRCKNGYDGKYCEYHDYSSQNYIYDGSGLSFIYENDRCNSNCISCLEDRDICLKCQKGCKLNNENFCECKKKKKLF